MTMIHRGVLRSGHNTYNSDYISSTDKHGGTVSVLHAFSAAGTGELLHCDKSVNVVEDRRL